MACQVAQHPGQGHLRFSSLESPVHRGLNPALRLWVAQALDEEIGISTYVLGRWERDCVDSLLDRRTTGGRNPGDPMRERADEVAELIGRQRSIDPAVRCGQLRVVILRAQHDFERTP